MVQVGPRPLVLAGPSGSGKSTLIKRLFEQFPSKFQFSISHTTRKPRAGEEHGIHYYFTDKDTMMQAIANDEFIESATFSGNTYGTSKQAVEDVQKSGKICVLDIDIQGVEQIRKTTLNPLTIFIKPPSLADLERRLRDRQTESEESLALRLTTAKRELEYGDKPGNFHHVIVNDQLERAQLELNTIVAREYGL